LPEDKLSNGKDKFQRVEKRDGADPAIGRAGGGSRAHSGTGKEEGMPVQWGANRKALEHLGGEDWEYRQKGTERTKKTKQKDKTIRTNRQRDDEANKAPETGGGWLGAAAMGQRVGVKGGGGIGGNNRERSKGGARARRGGPLGSGEGLEINKTKERRWTEAESKFERNNPKIRRSQTKATVWKRKSQGEKRRGAPGRRGENQKAKKMHPQSGLRQANA